MGWGCCLPWALPATEETQQPAQSARPSAVVDGNATGRYADQVSPQPSGVVVDCSSPSSPRVGLLTVHGELKSWQSGSRTAVERQLSLSMHSAQQQFTMASYLSSHEAIPSPISTQGSYMEVPFSDLQFTEHIGTGSFKKVYAARWDNTTVAVVCMRIGGMVTEARVMQQLSSHPNLVQFYRMSSDGKGNEFMVMELIKLGSLDKVLLSGVVLHTRAKLAMCEQVCSAMLALKSGGVLHRDLSARNVLVAAMEPIHVKVSDFGLARRSSPNGGRLQENQGLYNSGGLLVPVRWSAPEVLLRGQWSERSDVFSYGVLLWEVFSNGAEPWASKSEAEVVGAVIRGEVLSCPPHCPKPAYRLMLRCWALDPGARPNFQEIHDCFKDWRSRFAAKRVNRTSKGSRHGADDTGSQFLSKFPGEAGADLNISTGSHNSQSLPPSSTELTMLPISGPLPHFEFHGLPNMVVETETIPFGPPRAALCVPTSDSCWPASHTHGVGSPSLKTPAPFLRKSWALRLTSSAPHGGESSGALNARSGSASPSLFGRIPSPLGRSQSISVLHSFAFSNLGDGGGELRGSPRARHMTGPPSLGNCAAAHTSQTVQLLEACDVHYCLTDPMSSAVHQSRNTGRQVFSMGDLDAGLIVGGSPLLGSQETEGLSTSCHVEDSEEKVWKQLVDGASGAATPPPCPCAAPTREQICLSCLLHGCQPSDASSPARLLQLGPVVSQHSVNPVAGLVDESFSLLASGPPTPFPTVLCSSCQQPCPLMSPAQQQGALHSASIAAPHPPHALKPQSCASDEVHQSWPLASSREAPTAARPNTGSADTTAEHSVRCTRTAHACAQPLGQVGHGYWDTGLSSGVYENTEITLHLASTLTSETVSDEDDMWTSASNIATPTNGPRIRYVSSQLAVVSSTTWKETVVSYPMSAETDHMVSCDEAKPVDILNEAEHSLFDSFAVIGSSPSNRLKDPGAACSMALAGSVSSTATMATALSHQSVVIGELDAALSSEPSTRSISQTTTMPPVDELQAAESQLNDSAVPSEKPGATTGVHSRRTVAQQAQHDPEHAQHTLGHAQQVHQLELDSDSAPDAADELSAVHKPMVTSECLPVERSLAPPPTFTEEGLCDSSAPTTTAAGTTMQAGVTQTVTDGYDTSAVSAAASETTSASATALGTVAGSAGTATTDVRTLFGSAVAAGTTTAGAPAAWATPAGAPAAWATPADPNTAAGTAAAAEDSIMHSTSPTPLQAQTCASLHDLPVESAPSRLSPRLYPTSEPYRSFPCRGTKRSNSGRINSRPRHPTLHPAPVRKRSLLGRATDQSSAVQVCASYIYYGLQSPTPWTPMVRALSAGESGQGPQGRGMEPGSCEDVNLSFALRSTSGTPPWGHENFSMIELDLSLPGGATACGTGVSAVCTIPVVQCGATSVGGSGFSPTSEESPIRALCSKQPWQGFDSSVMEPGGTPHAAWDPDRSPDSTGVEQGGVQGLQFSATCFNRTPMRSLSRMLDEQHPDASQTGSQWLASMQPWSAFNELDSSTAGLSFALEPCIDLLRFDTCSSSVHTLLPSYSSAERADSQKSLQADSGPATSWVGAVEEAVPWAPRQSHETDPAEATAGVRPGAVGAMAATDWTEQDRAWLQSSGPLAGAGADQGERSCRSSRHTESAAPPVPSSPFRMLRTSSEEPCVGCWGGERSLPWLDSNNDKQPGARGLWPVAAVGGRRSAAGSPAPRVEGETGWGGGSVLRCGTGEAGAVGMPTSNEAGAGPAWQRALQRLGGALPPADSSPLAGTVPVMSDHFPSYPQSINAQLLATASMGGVPQRRVGWLADRECMAMGTSPVASLPLVSSSTSQLPLLRAQMVQQQGVDGPQAGSGYMTMRQLQALYL